MRGTPYSLDFRYRNPRIIPADAGNTDDNLQASAHTEDHPRGCGEHYVIPDGSRLPEGSSPRMRGTRPGG